MFALAVALASLVGLSLGLLGGGGSILTLPILRYALGLEMQAAVTVSLVVVGATSLAALVPHALAGRVRWRTGLVFGAAGMVGAFVAGKASRFVPPGALLAIFDGMMFVTAAAMLRGRRAPEGDARADLSIAQGLAQGLGVGALSGLVGAGGGFLVVPALVLAGGLSTEIAVGTSLLVIAMNSIAGLLGHVGEVAIPWEVAGLMAGAATIGSLGGAALARRAKPDTLRRGFAWFVLGMAFFVLGQELPRALGFASHIGVAAVAAVVATSLVASLARAAGRLSLERARSSSPS
jgi:uncharacterized membrane protein YfcA